MAQISVHLAIALWLLGAGLFVVVLALIVEAPSEVVWGVLLLGLVTASLEFLMRSRGSRE